MTDYALFNIAIVWIIGMALTLLFFYGATRKKGPDDDWQ